MWGKTQKEAEHQNPTIVLRRNLCECLSYKQAPICKCTLMDKFIKKRFWSHSNTWQRNISFQISVSPIEPILFNYNIQWHCSPLCCSWATSVYFLGMTNWIKLLYTDQNQKSLVTSGIFSKKINNNVMRNTDDWSSDHNRHQCLWNLFSIKISTEESISS